MMMMMTDGRELRQPRWRRPDDLKGDRSFLPTSHSLSCYVVPVRSETSAAHVNASFSQQ